MGDTENAADDCLECRLVSGFGCLGIGSYIAFQGRGMKGYNKAGMALVGCSFGVLGVMRLLGYSPFKEEKVS